MKTTDYLIVKCSIIQCIKKSKIIFLIVKGVF